MIFFNYNQSIVILSLIRLLTKHYHTNWDVQPQLIFGETLSFMMNSLTINEHQKKNSEFSSMLDSIRCGFPTDETILILNKRVIIQCAYHKHLMNFRKVVKVQCVFFLLRKACNEFNIEMLNSFSSKIHELVCTDEVDETISIYT